MFMLLPEFIIVNSVLSNYILCMMSSDPKQSGDLFSKCCFTVLKYRNSALEEAFSPDLLLGQFDALPPSSLWHFLMYEPIINGQQRGWLPLQYKHLAWGLTGGNVLYSRHLIGACVYAALRIHVILNAECGEAKFGRTITVGFLSLKYTNITLSNVILLVVLAEIIALDCTWPVQLEYLLENNRISVSGWKQLQW